MHRIWLSSTALLAIQDEANRIFPLETGGILLGYLNTNDELVIRFVSGPGPNAVHEPSRFTPDHKSQMEYLDAMYAEHGIIADYIGDWHTHPCTRPEMSLLDRCTLRRIAHSPEVTLESPIMLIAGGSPEHEWELRPHVYVRDAWWHFGALTHTPVLTIYDDDGL